MTVHWTDVHAQRYIENPELYGCCCQLPGQSSCQLAQLLLWQWILQVMLACLEQAVPHVEQGEGRQQRGGLHMQYVTQLASPDSPKLGGWPKR